jgi:hypothetical protein
MMTTKTNKKDPTSVDRLFVLGLDDAGKPRGARFKECENRTVSIALDMKLVCVHQASTAFAELGMKLPQGRIYASGKAFVPNIRRDLYDKLNAILAQPGDGSSILRLENPPNQPAATSDPAPDNVPCVSPTIGGLPRSWESVGVGHMVLVHESHEDGWWEAVVVAREDEVLTLRFRDYPKQPTFVRHLSAVALVNPGPA